MQVQIGMRPYLSIMTSQTSSGDAEAKLDEEEGGCYFY